MAIGCMHGRGRFLASWVLLSDLLFIPQEFDSKLLPCSAYMVGLPCNSHSFWLTLMQFSTDYHSSQLILPVKQNNFCPQFFFFSMWTSVVASSHFISDWLLNMWGYRSRNLFFCLSPLSRFQLHVYFGICYGGIIFKEIRISLQSISFLIGCFV